MASKVRIDLNVKRDNGTVVFTTTVVEAATQSDALALAHAALQAQADAASAASAEKVAAMGLLNL
jgi:hypothetical protein